MFQRFTQRGNRGQESHWPFRTLFMLAFTGIIGIVIIYFNVVSGRSDLAQCPNTWTLFALLLGVFLVEYAERYLTRHHEPPELSVALKAALLVVRMATVEAIVVLDCSGLGILLYPTIPFTAYFSLGSRTSTVLGFLSWGVAVSKIRLTGPNWYINLNLMTTLMIFTILLVFMLVIARIIDREERSRQHTERLLADLEASHLKLQAYAAQAADLAAMEERNRLARDIHDSLGHYLTAVNIQLEKALAYRDRNPAEATQAIRDAKRAAAEALQDVRRSVSALRSSEADFSLRAALRTLVDGVDAGGTRIELRVSGDETGYTRPVLMALYRAAQEGLTNIQKHAGAGRVAVDVELGEHEAHLALRDDGRGFDPSLMDGPLAASSRFGLQGIRERVELVSGRMAILSAPGQGTELRITLPKNPMQLTMPSAEPEEATEASRHD